MHPTEGGARAVNDRVIEFTGEGSVKFHVWGMKFCENVHEMTLLLEKMLRGRRFWRKRKLQLDLGTDSASIIYHGKRVKGPLTVLKEQRGIENEKIQAVIGDHEVDNATASMDLSEFSISKKMKRKLVNLLWERRYIFKSLGKCLGIEHNISPKPNVEPVCAPMRRRPPKQGEIQRFSMQMRIDLVVLEPPASPWATNDVFGKKDSGVQVTSDLKRLHCSNITASNPKENM